MTIQQRTTKILSSILIAGLCITPELMSAATQQNAQGPDTQSQSNTQATPGTSQDQTRSLLLKIGAIAAAGVAAGTVYALSRGTPSMPPNTNTAGATQK